MDTSDTFFVKLEPVTGAAFPQPVEVRLRSALKVLLRAFGLRCSMMASNPMPMPPQGPQPPEKRRKARSRKPQEAPCDSE